MRAFVLATLFVASCSAYGGAISSQYQALDHAGGYSYGYADPNSQKSETKDAHGVTHGGYSYVDAHGHTQSVKYQADPIHGFQIVHATNLPKGPESVHHAIAPVAAYHAPAYHYHGYGIPQQVQETPEVQAAKHAHFAAHAEANARLAHHGHGIYRRSIYGYAPAPVHGVPVDTPEVQHEKALHFAAVQKALHGHSGHANHYYQPQHQAWGAPHPVQDTPEVAHAKQAHFAAHAAARSGHSYQPESYQHDDGQYNHQADEGQYIHQDEGHYNNYHHEPKYSGPLHYPVIKNGVPVEPAEVQHARASHLQKVAEAGSYGHGYSHDDGHYNNHY